MGFVKNLVKSLFKSGWICGHEFPVGTFINLTKDENERAFLVTYPNKTEEKITHDMIKCATILAMGVIDIAKNNNQNTLLYGTKYLIVLKDGRQGVLTAGLGQPCNIIESVLF